MSAKHTIYTVGHSTHDEAEFIGMLQSFRIKLLVDIRRFPGSRKYPIFNQEYLAAALRQNGIGYLHLEGLGGRRPVRADSRNDRWRHKSFQGYADYMETGPFKEAIAELETVAATQSTAYMCAEAVWWRCHRSMVSDYLKAKGWTVMHIMSAGKAEEHPYTSPARIVDGQVFYCDENLIGATKDLMKAKFKVGDVVSWNSEAGRVSGTIIKVHTENFSYKGHTHHATEDDPQYEIKSSKTDHIAAHKGSALTKV